MIRFTRSHHIDIMLDSGAFTADRLGVEINVNDYALFLRRYGKLFNYVVNLDVMGGERPEENPAERSLANWRFLRRFHPCVMGVVHGGEDVSVVDEYLRDGISFLALGGVAGNPGTRTENFIKSVFARIPNDLPVHLLGLVNWKYMARYPFFSTDSRSWQAGLSWGSTYVDDRLRTERIPGYQRSKKRTLPRHSSYDSQLLSAKARKDPTEMLISPIKSVKKAEAVLTEHWKRRNIDWKDPGYFEEGS